jgi:hypothetical protein
MDTTRDTIATILGVLLILYVVARSALLFFGPQSSTAATATFD